MKLKFAIYKRVGKIYKSNIVFDSENGMVNSEVKKMISANFYSFISF